MIGCAFLVRPFPRYWDSEWGTRKQCWYKKPKAVPGPGYTEAIGTHFSNHLPAQRSPFHLLQLVLQAVEVGLVPRLLSVVSQELAEPCGYILLFQKASGVGTLYPLLKLAGISWGTGEMVLKEQPPTQDNG